MEVEGSFVVECVLEVKVFGGSVGLGDLGIICRVVGSVGSLAVLVVVSLKVISIAKAVSS